MRKNVFFKLVLTALILSFYSIQAQRYKTNIYNNNDIVKREFTYSITPAEMVFYQFKQLKLDYYSNENDRTVNKPAIFIVHGGGFFNGNKNDSTPKAAAMSFARKGYAVFTINYRRFVSILGIPNSCAGGVFNSSAIYWVMQDINAAIKSVVANKNHFKVDSNKIFLFGESAGAISVINSAYTSFNDIQRATTSFDARFHPLLGGIDRTTFPQYRSQNYKVAGVAAAAGGVTNANFVAGNENIPIVMLHNPCDVYVPYNSGQNGFINYFRLLTNDVHSCSGPFYGSKYIYDKIDRVAPYTSHKLYVSCKVVADPAPFGLRNHGLRDALPIFYNYLAPEFFYDVLRNKRQYGIIDNHYKLEVNFCDINSCRPSGVNRKELSEVNDFVGAELIAYPNPTTNVSTINLLSLLEEKLSISVVNSQGTVIKEDRINVDIDTSNYNVDLTSFPKGIYFVVIVTGRDQNKQEVIKIIKS